jgi:hypothetical protein
MPVPFNAGISSLGKFIRGSNYTIYPRYYEYISYESYKCYHHSVSEQL